MPDTPRLPEPWSQALTEKRDALLRQEAELRAQLNATVGAIQTLTEILDANANLLLPPTPQPALKLAAPAAPLDSPPDSSPEPPSPAETATTPG